MLYSNIIFFNIETFIGLWCLMPLSTIFHLYRIFIFHPILMSFFGKMIIFMGYLWDLKIWLKFELYDLHLIRMHFYAKCSSL
jgi:hypothetical protein